MARLRGREYFLGEEFIPEDFRAKDLLLRQHSAKFDLENGINLSPHNTDSLGLHIYADGSKMEGNAGSAFVALKDNTQLHEWMAKIQPENSVFQVELLAIYEAIIWATEQNVVCNIWSDSMSSLLAMKSLKTTNKTAKTAHTLLSQHPNITINWIKAGHLGNEKADKLAKKDTIE
ncbi:hypothetical protein AVEN_96990-1 [Araneus ventricosus]|uniref:RNase H type-1 domain-containing protein n=1 Tax=Araneus ventricosus TaxID=182803 RepID=A0A4Y2THW5_ARAVE|nr:hypothetical protein AVEN_75107-1 [Araneus ventricosus]GBO00165.1 hypothetical protein AVEN_96990-1 [Araneus ventricosus]